MLFRDIIIITIGGTLVSSLYLFSDQKSQNYTARYHGVSLSNWYLMDSFFESSFGFAVNVIWPYIITEWISYKFGIILLLYCFAMDESFRIFWFVYHHWFHQHINQKNIYLCIWATVNDINSYLLIPIFVWMYHLYKNQNKETEQTVELIPESNNIKQVMNEKSNIIAKLKQMTSSHFNKIIISYIGTAIWFTMQDGYQYYYQNEKWSPILRLPPFIFTSSLFLWEIYLCKTHKNDKQFIHFILLCLFIMCQELLFDWSILVFKVNDLTKHWNQHIAKIFVFACYTIYFKILSFISGLLTQHISNSKNQVVYELHFIFIVFFDVYLTLYLSASTTIDWTIIFMILIKLFAKFFKFNKKIRSYIPYLNGINGVNNKKITVHYVYSILASCVVYIGQITLLFIDYYIYTGNTGWILSPISAEKTLHNLGISIALLFISFTTEVIAFCLVYHTSKRSNEINESFVDESEENNPSYLQIQVSTEVQCHSSESSQYSIYESYEYVSLPVIYFICVVAYSQIASLNVTEFFPFYL